jgi:hypothetical protein
MEGLLSTDCLTGQSSQVRARLAKRAFPPALTAKGRKSSIFRPIGNGSVEPFPADRLWSRLQRAAGPAMLDKLEKTLDLVAAMKAAVPFEVELTPPSLARLRAENVASEIAPRQRLREVSYAGDEGGILCHIEPEGTQKRVIVSLTHVQIRRTLPFSALAFDYQKHRIKKLKKQQSLP